LAATSTRYLTRATIAASAPLPPLSSTFSIRLSLGVAASVFVNN
jgi:hypothetical protein